MNGRAVYEFATSRGAEVIVECLQKNKLDKSSVSKFILHQANINIIKAIAAKLEEPMDKFFVNLDKYGNTAGASTLIALDEYLASGCGESEHLLMSAFGGGLTWGALLLETVDKFMQYNNLYSKNNIFLLNNLKGLSILFIFAVHSAARCSVEAFYPLGMPIFAFASGFAAKVMIIE